MAEINLNELTKEQIEGAMECETPEELMAFAKKEGYEISEEEAKAYLAELEEVDGEVLKQVAGGAAANANEQKCKADSPVLHGMCVTGDTMLMLADGSEKRADALTGSERLLTWDFDKGMATGRKMFFLHKGTYDEPVNVLRLRFSDGGTVGVMGEHLFFDMTLGKFISIHEAAMDQNRAYTGHAFAKVSPAGKAGTVTLTDIVVGEKVYDYYAPIAEEHWSHMVNGMFSGCAYTLGMVNRFDFVRDELRYDARKKAADLKKYGRLPYETVAEYMSYELYKQNRFDEMSVAIAKGLLTEKELIGLIVEFGDFFFDEQRITYGIA